jgi:hypothetical protein
MRRLVTCITAAVIAATGIVSGPAAASAAPDSMIGVEVHHSRLAGPALPRSAYRAYPSDCYEHNMICLWTGYNGYGTVLIYHPSTIRGGRRLPNAYQNTVSSVWNRMSSRVYLYNGAACNDLMLPVAGGVMVGDLSEIRPYFDNMISSLADPLTFDGSC